MILPANIDKLIAKWASIKPSKLCGLRTLKDRTVEVKYCSESGKCQFQYDDDLPNFRSDLEQAIWAAKRIFGHRLDKIHFDYNAESGQFYYADLELFYNGNETHNFLGQNCQNESEALCMAIYEAKTSSIGRRLAKAWADYIRKGR